MKKFFVCVALIAFSAGARAEKTAFILSHVSPAYMAWWLGAPRQEEPYAVEQSRLIAAQVGWPVFSMPQKGRYKLPAGIESVSIDAPRRVFSATGDEAAMKELRKYIDALDRPMPEVEFESQLVRIREQDASQFGIAFAAGDAPFRLGTFVSAPVLSKGLEIGFVRNKFRATLDALESVGRSQTTKLPRVSTPDGVAALGASVSVSPLFADEATARHFVKTQIGFAAVPTINDDGTIGVKLALPFWCGLVQARGDKAGEADESTYTALVPPKHATVQIRDGDTIAMRVLAFAPSTAKSTKQVPTIRGIPLAPTAKIEKPLSKPRDIWLLFITTRIVRAE